MENILADLAPEEIAALLSVSNYLIRILIGICLLMEK